MASTCLPVLGTCVFASPRALFLELSLILPLTGRRCSKSPECHCSRYHVSPCTCEVSSLGGAPGGAKARSPSKEHLPGLLESATCRGAMPSFGGHSASQRGCIHLCLSYTRGEQGLQVFSLGPEASRSRGVGGGGSGGHTCVCQEETLGLDLWRDL